MLHGSRPAERVVASLNRNMSRLASSGAPTPPCIRLPHKTIATGIDLKQVLLFSSSAAACSPN